MKLIRIDDYNYNCIGCSLNQNENFKVAGHDFAAEHLLEHHRNGDEINGSQMVKIYLMELEYLKYKELCFLRGEKALAYGKWQEL